MFSLGDLAWARISHYPYWPAVITIEPNSSKKYTRVLEKHGSLRREYHLQFFEEPVQRAWVEQSNIIKFEGKYLRKKCQEKSQTFLKKLIFFSVLVLSNGKKLVLFLNEQTQPATFLHMNAFVN